MSTDRSADTSTQTQIVATFDDQPPGCSNAWPLYAETIQDAKDEYVADALQWGLPGPHAVTFWQRTTTITNSPWKPLHQASPKRYIPGDRHTHPTL